MRTKKVQLKKCCRDTNRVTILWRKQKMINHRSWEGFFVKAFSYLCGFFVRYLPVRCARLLVWRDVTRQLLVSASCCMVALENRRWQFFWFRWSVSFRRRRLRWENSFIKLRQARPSVDTSKKLTTATTDREIQGRYLWFRFASSSLYMQALWGDGESENSR